MEGTWTTGCKGSLIYKAQKKFISIHKPPACVNFNKVMRAIVLMVEPVQFSKAWPVAYEWGQGGTSWQN